MRWRTIALIPICLTISHLAASAESTKPKVYGAGASSCGVWLEERSKADGGTSELMLSWAFGYMTAMEEARTWPWTHLITDAPSARTFLDGFCKEYPDAQFHFAAVTLSYSQRTGTAERYKELVREMRSRSAEASN
jgi:hypothetical protein